MSDERKDRDLQTILSEDGKSSIMFDKSKAEEHRTDRETAMDHLCPQPCSNT